MDMRKGPKGPFLLRWLWVAQANPDDLWFDGLHFVLVRDELTVASDLQRGCLINVFLLGKENNQLAVSRKLGEVSVPPIRNSPAEVPPETQKRKRVLR